MELNKVLNLLTGVYDKCYPILQNHLLEPMTDSTRNIIISEILDATSYENDILAHHYIIFNGKVVSINDEFIF